MLPETFTITEHHLSQGHRGNALTCAIALCLHELTGDIWAITPDGCFRKQLPVGAHSPWQCVARLKPQSNQWREDYDNWKTVQPCTLTLEIL